MPEEVAPREVYGQTLVELGRENGNIVVLDADVSISTMTSMFKKAYPDRFIEVGIAEASSQHADIRIFLLVRIFPLKGCDHKGVESPP